MMAPPDYDGTSATTDTWGDSSGNHEVTYVHCPDAVDNSSFEIHLRNPRHTPMREQGIPEVPWRAATPLLPLLAREVARRAGRQRGWTGRNFRRAA